MAGSSVIVWQAESIENSDAEVLSFEMKESTGLINIVQQGPLDRWNWVPEQAGVYQVRVTAINANGDSSEGPWSEPFKITPPLEVNTFSPDRPAPQMAGASPINWAVAASGGVGEYSITFELEHGSNTTVVQSGTATTWAWLPNQAGNYRIRSIIEDSLGNRIESPWSETYEIVPELKVESFMPDLSSPQMAGTGPVNWTVSATGGVGDLSFSFELEQDGGAPGIVQSGVTSSWDWRPVRAGSYRVRCVVEDTRGHQFVSSWSDPYEITPPLEVDTPRPGKSAPQAALTKPITWMIDATGGVAPLSYELDLEQNGQLKLRIYSKSTPGWAWEPNTAGSYRVRAAVIDARGNRVESAWSDRYEIVPPLVIEPPVAGISGPQVIDTKLIPWSVSTSGGVGETKVAFELSRNDGEPRKIPGPSALSWVWQPEETGEYRVRAVVTDVLGNRQTSDWSEPYRIEPRLVIEDLAADRPAPQAARTVGILWTATASGGVGIKNYAFEISRNEETGPLTTQGVDNFWKWIPELEGNYRIRTIVTDALGNQLTSDWSKAYEIVPALQVKAPEPYNPADQYMIHAPINWSVQSSGGVGKRTYAFIYERKEGETVALPGSYSSGWKWRPDAAGFYRVRVLVTDALGNQKKSRWSDWKEIRTPLALGPLLPSRPSPQKTLQGAIHWRAKSSGGVGSVSYEFRSLMSGVESIEQTGPSPELHWDPRKAGLYQLKVRAWDEDGHTTETDWSDEYLLTPAITSDSLVAILPLENLADVKVSLPEFDYRYRDLLGDAFQFLPAKTLENFMQTHRVRYTGGIGLKLATALQEETGTDAVLISNMETWNERGSPRVAVISRLVTTGENPAIVWIDSVGLTGEDSPGLLGIGRIRKPQELLNNALKRLAVSLQSYLAGTYPSYRHMADQQGLRLINGTGTADGAIGPMKGRHLPQFSYRATSFDPAIKYRVAVIPFLNINARKHAGKIVALHTVKQFHRYANIQVIEPGLIREALLKYRMVMQSGPSLAASDLLHSPDILGADIIVSGRAFDYQGEVGKSKVDFSVQAFDGVKREVLWASRSYAVGDEGVYFFDWGRVLMAHGLTSYMTQAVINLLEE